MGDVAIRRREPRPGSRAYVRLGAARPWSRLAVGRPLVRGDLRPAARLARLRARPRRSPSARSRACCSCVLMARGTHIRSFRSASSASRNFAVTNLSTFLIYGALYVVLYLHSIFSQGTLGYSAAAAGSVDPGRPAPDPPVVAMGGGRPPRAAPVHGDRSRDHGGGPRWLARIPATAPPGTSSPASRDVDPAPRLPGRLPAARSALRPRDGHHGRAPDYCPHDVGAGAGPASVRP